MKLDQARVLVTGGSSGIGLEVARDLVARGAAVAICGRDGKRLEAAAEDTGAIPIEADVSLETDVERLVAEAHEQLGGLNVLVNNAGFGSFSELTALDVADMDSIWATNVRGAMLVARQCARSFIRDGVRGNIINVASTAGQRGFAGGTAYVASKFALRGMTECWRAELRKHDIRVMLVNPSEVQTEFFSVAGGARKPSERKLRPLEIAHAVSSMLEMDDRGFITDLTVWATNPD
ncbi:MAG: SDR family oxidoreductase [Thermoanaerobaculia bacterium]